jgi:DNA primase
MDVITAYQNDFSNVVASMGTSLTEKQVSAIKRLTKNMVLALDADAAGEEATLRAVTYENTLNAEVKVIILPQGKDPDDVIREDPQTWQNLLGEALPIVDYTFNMVASGLDLTTAKDKSLAVDKLLPIVVELKNVVRQAHYLQKLARLVKVSERSLEAALGRTRTDKVKVKAKELKQGEEIRRLQPLLSSPVEEECLAWLLHYPELQTHCQDLLPEYFENSENREIFLAWHKVNDLTLLRERLDAAIHEHFNSLVARSLPPTSQARREDVITGCILRLREKFLRSLAAKRGEILALEAESGGTVAELAKLQEQGVEASKQLGEVFTQKSRRR